jgi:peptidoglycan hydrolase CwlO-like protein
MSDEQKKDSLNDWGINVDRFKERAKESLAGAKDDLSEVAGTLRQTLLQAKDVLVGLQKGGSPAAAELKSGFEKAWTEIENAFKAARERAKEAREAAAAAPDEAAPQEAPAQSASESGSATDPAAPPSDDSKPA